MVDKRQLAMWMLAWETRYGRLMDIQGKIEQAILELEDTVVTGNVIAKYNKGRKSYKYQDAFEALLAETNDRDTLLSVVEANTVMKPSISWKPVCQELDIKDIPVTQGEPSVSVRLAE